MYELQNILKQREPENQIEYYFRKVKILELSDEYVNLLNDDAKMLYAGRVKGMYDVLYDRIISSEISPFLKEEVELWYDFNRDFMGFIRAEELNGELEEMLNRFELI